MTKPKTVPFEKLTKPQKRVRIAQDVIAQLNTRLVAKHLTWARLKGLHEAKPDAEVCAITRKQKKCEVCGLGALFVAAVERADKLKISELDGTGLSDGVNETDVFDYLGRFFDQKQLQAIESAFEGGEGYCDDDGGADFLPLDIGISPSTRMRLIMENIVANKGRFKPNRKPVATFTTPGY